MRARCHGRARAMVSKVDIARFQSRRALTAVASLNRNWRSVNSIHAAMTRPELSVIRVPSTPKAT